MKVTKDWRLRTAHPVLAFLGRLLGKLFATGLTARGIWISAQDGRWDDPGTWGGIKYRNGAHLVILRHRVELEQPIHIGTSLIMEAGSCVEVKEKQREGRASAPEQDNRSAFERAEP